MPRRAARGFTLLELLVVLSIMALATAGVGLALRDGGATLLQREGERLAMQLEVARAQSRASGVPVRWRSDAAGGFVFDGLPGAMGARRPWLDGATGVSHISGVGGAGGAGSNHAGLWLGPEPLIGAQQVVLVNAGLPGRMVVVATDGLRPFAVQALP